MSTGNSPSPSAAVRAEFDDEYGEALRLLREGRAQEARGRFLELERSAGREDRERAERARTWAKICERRSGTAAAPEPQNAEERYYRGVVELNLGRYDDAVRLLTAAMQDHPTSPDYLYARASAYSMKGNPEAAVGDLRQAIQFNPRLRFQAVNDPDFEPIREEPAFIDIIEPTPSGA